jgi:Fur family ferric uptake transcriptional regulator
MAIDASDLRQRGIRLTPQRRMILNAITRSSGHVTAEDIYQHVAAQYPDMNISTVYRNLERLCDLRLVAVTDMGGGHVRYEALGRARHHHLICHACGAISALDDSLVADLRERIAQAYGFAADIDHLAIWGLCATCKASTQHHEEEDRAHS